MGASGVNILGYQIDPAVFGAATAIIGALIGHALSHRSNMRQQLSQMRALWIERFREEVAEYIASITRQNTIQEQADLWETVGDENFIQRKKTLEEFTKSLHDGLVFKNKILLALNHENETHLTFAKALEELSKTKEKHIFMEKREILRLLAIKVIKSMDEKSSKRYIP